MSRVEQVQSIEIPKGVAPFLGLPHELGSLVLEYLDLASLARACLICKGWYALASSEQLWARHKNQRVCFLGCSPIVYQLFPAMPNRKDYELLTHESFKRSNMRMLSFGGHIYVAGGYDLSYDPWTVSTLERVSPEKQCVEKLAPMTEIREGFGFVKVGDYLYAFGGTDGHTYLRTMERYDIANDTWTKMEATLPFQLAYFSYAVVNEEIYVVGGSGPGSPSSVSMRFNVTTNKWNKIPQPQSGELLGMKSFKGELYLKREKFSPATEEWTACKSPLASGLKHLFVWNGTFYGLGEDDSLNKWDPDTESWHQAFTLDSDQWISNSLVEVTSTVMPVQN